MLTAKREYTAATQLSQSLFFQGFMLTPFLIRTTPCRRKSQSLFFQGFMLTAIVRKEGSK